MAASTKLNSFTESVIREMTRLSDQYGAINLSQGMPDFPPSPKLTEAAVEAIRRGSNQYTTTSGHEGLRQAVANRVREYNGIEANPEKNITITCGSTEALAAAVFGLTNSGDRIIITDPFYENYVPDTILAGCEPLYVPFSGRDLMFDEEALKDAMETHPKLIVLNTPNNPTGKVAGKEELKLIADLCQEKKTIAITDEIYEYIVYDGKKHVSLASLGGMQEQTVTVSSASKTYSVTGWRVGWAVAEAGLTEALRKVHDYFAICAPAPLQEALVTALNFKSSYYEKLKEAYDGKRRMMMKILDEAGLQYQRPEGAYYMLVNVPDAFKDDKEFSDYLLKEIGVAVLPANALCHDKDLGRKKVRLAYCKKDSTLQEVRRRFRKLAEKPKSKPAVSTKL
ncbi:MAG: pyridoxal phosphate-dependent aminotransferase [Candidatus Bathyarchaeia archaeon]